MNKKVLIVSLLLFCCGLIIYNCSAKTSSSYESETAGVVSTKLAGWKIKVNNELITDSYEHDITVADLTFSGNHTRESKMAPGSKANLSLQLNTTDTEVAVRIDLSYIDRSVDESYILTLEGIDYNSTPLVKTAANTYTLVLPLSEVIAFSTKTINIALAWENNEDNNDRDSHLGLTKNIASWVDFDFVASQYQEEEIVPYE